jgi:SAM-dependent methyltransferase
VQGNRPAGRKSRIDPITHSTAVISDEYRGTETGPAHSERSVGGKVRQCIRRLRRALQGAWFDWRLGVKTSRRLTLPDYDRDHHGYEAADVWQLPKLLPRHEIGPFDVFVDVGAGKGRVLMYAVRYYNFFRVVGVELSPELAAIARENVQARPAAEQNRIVIVEADAASWTVPDDATVFHMFNPFRGDAFRAFMAGMVESQIRRPRLLRLVYTHGQHHKDVLDAGFEMVRKRPRFALYERRP